MKAKMSVQILSHNLSYAPRGGEEQFDAIYTPVSALKIATSATDHAIHPLVYQLLEGGTLTIKSSASSKSIFAGVKYVIAKPVDTGFALHHYYVESLADVRRLLQEGWRVCKQSPSVGLLDVLVPSDSEYLVESIDLSMRWREAVAAVINLEIESNCNWSTGSSFSRVLGTVVKSTEVTVPEDCRLLTPGDVVKADEFVTAYVLRGLETHLNAVFEFFKNDPNALYVAEATNTGILVNQYADVRAFLWHVRFEQERLAREQAIEDGLGNAT